MGEKTNEMNRLQVATSGYLASLVSKRQGEVKLGERIQTLPSGDWKTELANSNAKYVLLGIPEDIGVRANYGVGGAHTLWEPALKAIVNVQDTDELAGNHILLLGAFDLRELMERSQGLDALQLRQLVSEIDEIVAPVIEAIASAGKIPVVIGGGHNNSYPIIKGISKGLGEKINCINLDAHTDYRALEGRHSGNGFRYAMHDGFLDKYAIAGLHSNYNAQNIIDELGAVENLSYSLYDDIFIKECTTFKESVDTMLSRFHGSPIGIELDMDCIARVLASAATPSGISALQARQYLSWCGQNGEAAYLHLPEGVYKRADGAEDILAAKMACYLVTDFIRANQSLK